MSLLSQRAKGLFHPSNNSAFGLGLGKNDRITTRCSVCLWKTSRFGEGPLSTWKWEAPLQLLSSSIPPSQRSKASSSKPIFLTMEWIEHPIPWKRTSQRRGLRVVHSSTWAYIPLTLSMDTSCGLPAGFLLLPVPVGQDRPLSSMSVERMRAWEE